MVIIKPIRWISLVVVLEGLSELPCSEKEAVTVRQPHIAVISLKIQRVSLANLSTLNSGPNLVVRVPRTEA